MIDSQYGKLLQCSSLLHQMVGAARLTVADTDNPRNPVVAKKKTSGKRPIVQYDHKDKTRVNNLPVGLVTPKTDPDQGRKTYQPEFCLRDKGQGIDIEGLLIALMEFQGWFFRMAGIAD